MVSGKAIYKMIITVPYGIGRKQLQTDHSEKEIEEVIAHANHLYDLSLTDPNNKLKKNYTKEERFPGDVYAVSVTDTSVCCLSWRPLYGNTIRVGTRYYYRTEKPTFNATCRPDTVVMVDHQADFAYDLGFDGVFISRDDETSRRFQRVTRGMNRMSKYDWNLSEEKLRVTDKYFQWIIWNGDLQLENH